ncbi:TIGR00725 family protein [Streptomyces adustus]|uniref:TIGR00725 family protein n=1 Tax=Streptomyces adustus TaxID=1609272 RepID=A0A5N8VG88_9ACTN|nr:TIGR00725 family protein [Streptomyces adustus]MPY34181.1 TIGR00725 family protein [Streptomyces adustus]
MSHGTSSYSSPVPRRALYVAVVGPGAATPSENQTAQRLGRLLAQQHCIVICGGLGGVMEAVCRGAQSEGGITVGLLPGSSRATGNDFLSVALPTGLGELRNGLVVRSADAVIVVGGSWGTLSEMALAVRTGKPTIVISGWEVRVPGKSEHSELRLASSAEDAVGMMFSMVGPETATDDAV